MFKRTFAILSIIFSTQFFILISPCVKNYINIYKNDELVTYMTFIKMQQYIFSFILLQYFLTFLPGNIYNGPKPIDKRQITPTYKENGVKAFILNSLIIYSFCKYEVINYMFIYDNIDILWLSLNVYALLLCLILLNLSKSRGFNDYNSNIERFYLGQELYPLINNFNIKFFTNCRFGMMLWPTLLIIYINCHYKLNNKINMSMLSNFIIQMIYIFKFYLWEKGYMNSLDIIHDKAGYYICWGCIVWVPSFYTLSGYYLVNNVGTTDNISLLLLIIGVISTILNYWSDNQKIIFRESKGKCKIFFNNPTFIVAKYTHDKNSSNLLLTSGFWGISRHFNYFTELIAAYSWCLNCNSIFGLMYPIYLTVLLVHRSKRDYSKCNNKYSNWSEYCNIVKYNIIPLIY